MHKIPTIYPSVDNSTKNTGYKGFPVIRIPWASICVIQSTHASAFLRLSRLSSVFRFSGCWCFARRLSLFDAPHPPPLGSSGVMWDWRVEQITGVGGGRRWCGKEHQVHGLFAVAQQVNRCTRWTAIILGNLFWAYNSQFYSLLSNWLNQYSRLMDFRFSGGGGIKLNKKNGNTAKKRQS